MSCLVATVQKCARSSLEPVLSEALWWMALSGALNRFRAQELSLTKGTPSSEPLTFTTLSPMTSLARRFLRFMPGSTWKYSGDDSTSMLLLLLSPSPLESDWDRYQDASASM